MRLVAKPDRIDRTLPRGDVYFTWAIGAAWDAFFPRRDSGMSHDIGPKSPEQMAFVIKRELQSTADEMQRSRTACNGRGNVDRLAEASRVDASGRLGPSERRHTDVVTDTFRHDPRDGRARGGFATPGETLVPSTHAPRVVASVRGKRDRRDGRQPVTCRKQAHRLLPRGPVSSERVPRRTAETPKTAPS